MNEWPKDISLAGSRFTLDCAHRVINDRDPSLTDEMRTDRSEDQLLREEEGVLFEYNVRTELVALHEVVDLALINDYMERTEATIRAMTRGDSIIVGAALPASNGRSGAPDILIRCPLKRDGSHAYFPVDVKNHKPLEGSNKATEQTVSTLQNLNRESAEQKEIGPGVPNSDDSLILCHYWRLLESLGNAPETEPFGAIIGTDKHLVWRSLVDPLKTYDTEFEFRLSALLALVGQDPPQTKPIWNPSWCDKCHWREHCKEKLLAKQHVSLIKGVSFTKALALDLLSPTPIRSWSDLANASAPNLVMKGWPNPQVEIDHARARLSGSGLPFTPRDSDDLAIPRADVEIDFDMESIQKSEATGRADCVYLWGTLTTIRDEGLREKLGNPMEGFHGFSIFEENETEADALESFWKWAQDWIAKSKQLGFSLHFYCYHGAAESTAMKAVAKRWAGNARPPVAGEIEAFMKTSDLLDIEKYVKKFIWPTESQGLKVIGKIAGANWDDKDANGALSTVWFDRWLQSSNPTERETLKQQLLDYNRNDVEATLIIRNWINDGLVSNPPKFKQISSLDGRTF